MDLGLGGGGDGNQDGVLGAYGIKMKDFVDRNRCCVCSYVLRIVLD